MRTAPPLPLPVGRALAKLGGDIKSARLRRRLTAAMVAERTFITRSDFGEGGKGRSGGVAGHLCDSAVRAGAGRPAHNARRRAHRRRGASA